jgi:hypothetical protein
MIRSVDHACRVELGRAVMDLGGWLRRLGLEKYEAVFRENEIDVDVLPELTELDLENDAQRIAFTEYTFPRYEVSHPRMDRAHHARRRRLQRQ